MRLEDLADFEDYDVPIPTQNDPFDMPPYKRMLLKVWDYIKNVVTVNDDLTGGNCSDLQLNCFPLNRYLFFILGSVVIPYFLYQKVAEEKSWTERRVKSESEHLESIFTAVAYSTLLFVFGNYKNTFDWVTSIVVTLSILGFGYLTDLPFAHQSLSSFENWNGKMWTLMGVSVGIVLLFASYCIYLSTKQDNPNFWKWYVGCLIIPICLGAISYRTVQNQNNDPKEKKKVTLHLHHFQIFLVLAFFTRFPNLPCRIAAGIVLGIFLHGGASYGFDTSFEQRFK